jgi:hypothetical protein
LSHAAAGAGAGTRTVQTILVPSSLCKKNDDLPAAITRVAAVYRLVMAMTVGRIGPACLGRTATSPSAPSAAPASVRPATSTAAPASNDDAYNEEHDNTNPTADGPSGSVAGVAGRVHATVRTYPRYHIYRRASLCHLRKRQYREIGAV